MMFRFRRFSYIFVFLFTLTVCVAPAFSYTHDCRRKSNENAKSDQGNRIMQLIPLMLLLLSLFDKHNDSIGETSSESTLEEIDVPADIDWDSLCEEFGLKKKGSGSSDDDSSDDDDDKNQNGDDDDDGTSGKNPVGGTDDDDDGDDDGKKGQTATETPDVCDNNSTLCDDDLSSISRSKKTVVGWTSNLDGAGVYQGSDTDTSDAGRFQRNLDKRIQATVVTGEILGQTAERLSSGMDETRKKVSNLAKSTRTIAQGKQNEATAGALEMETLAVNNELAGNELLLQSLVSAKKHRDRIGTYRDTSTAQ